MPTGSKAAPASPEVAGIGPSTCMASSDRAVQRVSAKATRRDADAHEAACCTQAHIHLPT
jgi:hypothetical protein